MKTVKNSISPECSITLLPASITTREEAINKYAGINRAYFSKPLTKLFTYFIMGMLLFTACKKEEDILPPTGSTELGDDNLKVSGLTYYIAPNGSDAANGDISHPFATLNKAWTVVAAGDLVYMRGGTYLFNSQQVLSGKNGTASNLIKVWAYPGETPILSKSGSYSANYGIHFVGNYVHFKGLEITGYAQKPEGNVSYGFLCLGGNNNIFETLNSHDNGNGFCIRGHNYLDNGNATGNLVLNCDFHHNKDPYSADPYGNADGMSIAYIGAGNTNTIRGCRFWWNTDDGVDLWHNDGAVIFENCWSFYNGFLPGTFTTAGDGNGFKLGPNAADQGTSVLRTITNCVAFRNQWNGFTDNNAFVRMNVYNNIAYFNGTGSSGSGFNINNIVGASTSVIHTVKNNIAYGNKNKQGLFTAASTLDKNTFLLSTWTDIINSLYNVTDSDFTSITPTGIDGARQSDGSLPIIAFLHLGTGSDLINTGINVGLPYNGTAPDLAAFETSVGGSTGNQSPVISNQTFQVNENSANGTTVGTVIASDPDAGQTLTYSILSGNTSGAFAINTTTGKLTVANSSVLVYNTNPSFSLVVKVLDNGNPALSSQATITINLLPAAAGNNPPVINNQSFSVAENSANGTTVGTVIASDPNAGQSLTYSILSGNTSGAFAINTSTGKLTVANSSVLIYNTNPSFSLVVKVLDNGNPALSSQATITINLIPAAGNNPPVINNQSFTVSKYASNGTTVGTVIATDPNAGQSLTYAITAGNSSNAFSINSTTGVIKVNNKYAFWYKKKFYLTVKVTDNGSPSMNSSATMTITVQ